MQLCVEMGGSDIDQPSRRDFLQLVPPNRFSRFANRRFFGCHNSGHAIGDRWVQRPGRFLQLSDQLVGVVNELTTDQIATQRPAQHQCLKWRQILDRNLFADQRLQDADQPSSPALAWRQFLKDLRLFNDRFRLPLLLAPGRCNRGRLGRRFVDRSFRCLIGGDHFIRRTRLHLVGHVLDRRLSHFANHGGILNRHWCRLSGRRLRRRSVNRVG